MTPDNLELLKKEYEEGTSRRAYLPYADALRRGKQLQQALAVCQAGLEKEPQSLTGRSLLARIYYDMGRYDSSVETLRQIVAQEPMALQSRMLLVKALLRRRQINEAEEECARLQEMIPDDERVQILARDIRNVKTKMQATGRSSDMQDMRAAAGFQNKYHQIKKAMNKSPFIDEVGMISESAAHSDTTGARLALMVEQIRKPVGDAGFGSLKTLQCEMEGSTILMYAVDEDFLFVKSRPECKIGRLRYQIEMVLGA